MSEPEKGGEERKRNKRIKPDHESSFEREEEIFGRSKIIARSPPLNKEKPEAKEMEEIKKMLMEIKGDISEVKAELKQNNEEVKQMREEINSMKQEWKNNNEDMLSRIKVMERRIEKLEKEKIRNNLIITGIETDTNNREGLIESIENLIRQELRIKVKVRNAYKVSMKKCIAEMEKWEDKVEILKNKGKLNGKEIYIDSEMTLKEREIQKKIRDYAKEVKSKGARVKVRFQKLEINGRIMKWDHKEQRLMENEETYKTPKN